jgi:threonine dehydrogenase-like Zn-dependent dehydrogenase
MQQLTFMEPGRLAWQEVPTATLKGDGEAIVRPVAVANCDLDGLMFKGLVPVAAPFAVGHEFIAEVVEVGPSVTSARPGDRVIVPFQVSCGVCDRCRRGLTANCQAVERGSAYGLGRWGAPSGAGRYPISCACPSRTPCWCHSPLPSTRWLGPAPMFANTTVRLVRLETALCQSETA